MTMPAHVARALLSAAALTLLLILTAGDVSASAPLTFNVNITADIEDPLLGDNNCDTDLPSVGAQCSLRAAISQANFTDGLQIINVPAGAYNLTIDSSLRIQDEVTINGAGSETVFVDAAAITDRVFWNLASGVEISGLTIRNGTTSSGGGIRNTGHLTLEGVDIIANVATDSGGGIWNESILTLVDSYVGDNTAGEEGGGIMNGTFATLSITDSDFSGNDANPFAWGGGVHNLGEASITGTTFTDNTAGYGGAIGNEEGPLTVTSSTLSGNFADASGGGMANYEGVLAISNSYIDDNSADLVGGGIVNWGGEITITGGTVNDNATDAGGGIYNEGGASGVGVATLSHTAVEGNTATQGHGGGIWNNSQGEIALIAQTQISQNTASLSGGGIANDGALTMDDSEVNDNSAGARGGGIFNTGNATLDSVTVEGNTAGAAGGIDNYEDDSALAVTSSTISGNVSESQGGGVVNKGTATISNSTISENTASDAGGGVFSINQVTLKRTLVAHNTSESRGGGIATYAGNLLVDESLIYYNTAQDGGGVLNCADGVISNSTVSGNGAHGTGGILIGRSEVECPYTLTLTNVTVTWNVSAIGGDGLDVDEASGGHAVLKNTILAGSIGTGTECEGASAITSDGHNLGDDDSCGLTASGDLPSTDPLLADLSDNGGPTQTHALLPGSPAIDAGSQDCPPPAIDQRSYPRPLDGDLDGEARCDIGAYEAARGTTPTPTPSPTSTLTPIPGEIGDVNCDEDVNSGDGLVLLQHIAGTTPDQAPGCPPIGSEVASVFGDVDCDEDVDAGDVLLLFRYVADIPNYLPEGCGPIGPATLA